MKKITILILAAMVMSCTPKCKKRTNYAVDASLLICEIMAAEMTNEERGFRNPKQWCNIAENFAPYFEEYVHNLCPEERAEIKD